MLKWWHIKLSERNEFIPIKHTKESIEWYKALKAGIIGLPTVQLYNKSEHFQSKTCSTQSKTDQKISIINKTFPPVRFLNQYISPYFHQKGKKE